MAALLRGPQLQVARLPGHPACHAHYVTGRGGSRPYGHLLGMKRPANDGMQLTTAAPCALRALHQCAACRLIQCSTDGGPIDKGRAKELDQNGGEHRDCACLLLRRVRAWSRCLPTQQGKDCPRRMWPGRRRDPDLGRVASPELGNELGLFLDDAVLYPAESIPRQRPGGRSGHRWRNFPPMKDFTASSVVEGRDLSLAYVLGTYTMTIAPAWGTRTVTDSGKSVGVEHRQPDGRSAHCRGHVLGPGSNATAQSSLLRAPVEQRIHSTRSALAYGRRRPRS